MSADFKKDEKVLYRGRWAKRHSVRGTVEEAGGRGVSGLLPTLVGVRLENGNFVWASHDQLRRR